MTFRLRSALLVLTGLTAMSVAPAQAGESPNPLSFGSSTTILSRTALQPTQASVRLPDTAVTADPGLAHEESRQLVDTPLIAAPSPTGELADKVAALRGSDPGSRELECLAVGIYYESKSEPLAGQLAVGQVIANRAKSGRFAPTYCGVLFQRSQFSFVRNKSYTPVPRASRQWHNAVAVAKIVARKLHISQVPGALFFHAKRVSPRWRLSRVGSVGNHVFYR